MASFLTYGYLDSFSEISQDGTPPLNSRPESGEIVDSDSSENRRVTTSGAPRTAGGATGLGDGRSSISESDGFSVSPPPRADQPAMITNHRSSHPERKGGAGRRGTDRGINGRCRSKSRRRGRSGTRGRYRSPSRSRSSRRSRSRERRRRPPRSRSRDRRRSSSSRSRSSSPRQIQRRHVARRSRSRSRRRVRNRSRSRHRRFRSSSRGSPCRRGRSRSVRARGSSERLSRSHSSSPERRSPLMKSHGSGSKPSLVEAVSDQPGVNVAFLEKTTSSAQRTSTSVAGTPYVVRPDGHPDLPSKESLLELMRRARDGLRGQTSNVPREPMNSPDASGQGQTRVEHASGTEDDDGGGSSPEVLAYDKSLGARAVGGAAKFGDEGGSSQDVTVQSRRMSRPFCEIREGVKKTGGDSGFRSRNASASHQDNGTQGHGTPRSRTGVGAIFDPDSVERVQSFITELENFSAPLATTGGDFRQNGATTAGGNGQTRPAKIWPPPPPSPSDDPKKFALRKRLNDILTQVFKHTEQTSENGCMGSRVDSSEPVPRAGQDKSASAGKEPISFTSHQLTQIKQLTSDISQARKKPSVPLVDISSSGEASPREPNLTSPSRAEASLPAVRDGQQSAPTVSAAGASPSSVPRDPRKRPAGRRSPQVREGRNDPAVNDARLPARLNKRVPPAPTLRGLGLDGTESRPQNPPTLPGSSHGPSLQHQFLPSGPLPFNGHVPIANHGGFPQHQPPSHMVGFSYGPPVPFMSPGHIASPIGPGGVMANCSFNHGPQFSSNFNHNLPHHSNFNSAQVFPTMAPGMMHGHHSAQSQGYHAPTNLVAEPQLPVRPHPEPPFNAPPIPPAVAPDQTRTRDSSQQIPRDPRLKLRRQPAPPAPPPSKPKQPPKKSDVWGRKKSSVSAEFAPPKQPERASSQRCKPLVNFKIPKIRPSRVEDEAQTDLALPVDREAEEASDHVLDSIKAAEEHERQTKEKLKLKEEEDRKAEEERKRVEEEERNAKEEKERLAELERKAEEERKQQEALAAELEQERKRQEEEKETIEEERRSKESERKLHEELESLAKAQSTKCQEMEEAECEEAFYHHPTTPEVVVLDDIEAEVDANERDVLDSFSLADSDVLVIPDDDNVPEPFEIQETEEAQELMKRQETDEEPEIMVVGEIVVAPVPEEATRDAASVGNRRSTRMSKKDTEKETTEMRPKESMIKTVDQTHVAPVAGTSETVDKPLPKKRGRKSKKELQESAERAAEEKALQEEAEGTNEEVIVVHEEASVMVENVAQDLQDAAAETTGMESLMEGASAAVPFAHVNPLLSRCEECSCEVEHLVAHYHARHEGLDIPTAVPEAILKNLLRRRQEARLAPLDLSWMPEGEKFPVAVRCNICGAYSTTQRQRLIQHVQKSHGKTYLCTLCPDRSSIYNVYPEFIDHLASVHTGEWFYECNLCHKKFGDATTAKLHMQLGTHKDNQKAQCPRLRLCDGEEASTEGILYLCSVCGFCKLNRTLVEKHLGEKHAEGRNGEEGNGPCVLEFNAGIEFSKVKESTSGSKRGRKKKVAEAASKATPKKGEVVPEPSAPEVVPEPIAPEVVPEPIAPEVVPKPSAPEVAPEPSAPEVVPEPSAPEVIPESIPKRSQESASTFLPAAAMETLEAGELEEISEVVASAEESPQRPGPNRNRRSMSKVPMAPKMKTTVNELSMAGEGVRPGQQTSNYSPSADELMPMVGSNISPGAPSSASHGTQSTLLVSVAGGSVRPDLGAPRRVIVPRSQLGAHEAVPRKVRSKLLKCPALPPWKTEREEGPMLKMKPPPAQFRNPWHSTDSKKSGEAWEVLLSNPGKLEHPFKCLGYHCSFTTADASVFCAHVMMCHDQGVEDGSTGCMYCFMMFQHPAELTVHILEVHSDWNFRCSKCTGRFPNDSKALKHVAKHRSEDGTVCAHVVSSEHKFQRGRFPVPSPAETMEAMRARPFVARVPVRPLTFEKIWKMEYGGLYNMLKNPDLIPDLMRHKQLVDLFKCASYDCSFVTREEDSFMEHLAHHSTADALMCIYCLEVFGNEQELAAHVKNNHGACEYQCPECFYRCVTRGLLEHHKKMLHSSTCKTIPIRVQPVAQPDTPGSVKAGPYVCAFASCKFVVFDAVGFRNHFRDEHAKSRNFPCAQCGLSFGTPDELIKHSRKHGLQNIHCSLCSMAFASDEALQRHSALVHSCKFAGVTRRKKDPQPETMEEVGSTSGEGTSDAVADHSPPQPANMPGAVGTEPVKRGEFFVYPPGKDFFKCPRSLFKDACTEEFSTAEALRRHLKLCSMVGYWCPLCRTIRRRYTSAAEYFEHLAKDHTLETTLFLCGSCESTASDVIGIRRHWSREHAKDEGFGMLTPVDSVNGANDFLKEEREPGPRRPLDWGTDATEWDGAMFVITGNKSDRKPSCDVVDANANLDKLFHAMSVLPQPVICDHCPFQTRMVKNMASHMAVHRLVNSGDLPSNYGVLEADLSKFSSPPKKTKEELEWNKMRNLAFGAKEIGEDGSELPSIPTGQSIIKNMMYPRFVNSYMRYLCPSNYCLFVAKAFDDLDEHLRFEHPTTRTYRCRHCHPNADLPIPADLLFNTVRDLWDHCELHGDTLVQCGGCHMVGTDSEKMGDHYLLAHQACGPEMLDAGPLPVVDQKAMIVLREFNAGRWRAEDLGEVSEEKKDLAKKQEEERELNNAAKNKRRKRTANARPAEGGTSARFSQDQQSVRTIPVAEEGSTAHLVPTDLDDSEDPEGTPGLPPVDPAAPLLDGTPGPSEVDKAMPSLQKKRKTLEEHSEEPALPAVEEVPVAPATSGVPPVYDPSWKHVCDKCQERFLVRGDLRAHQKSTHAQPVPGQMVPCSICGRKVVHRDDLKLHYAKYHPGLPLPLSGAPALNVQAAAVSNGARDRSQLAGVHESKGKIEFRMQYSCPESLCKSEEKLLYPDYIKHLQNIHGLQEPIHVSRVNKGRAGYSPSHASNLADTMVKCGHCSMGGWMKLVVKHILAKHTPGFMPFQFEVPVTIFEGNEATWTDQEKNRICIGFSGFLLGKCQLCDFAAPSPRLLKNHLKESHKTDVFDEDTVEFVEDSDTLAVGNRWKYPPAIAKPQAQPSSVPGPSAPQGHDCGRTSNSSDSSSVASSLASAPLAYFGVVSTEPRTARPSRDIDLNACAAVQSPPDPKPSSSAGPPMKSQVFQCPECFVEKEFTGVEFRIHLKQHRPIWKCPLCETTLVSDDAASAHRYEFHADAVNFELEDLTAHQEWIEAEFRKFMAELVVVHPPGSPKNPPTPAARKRNAAPSTSTATAPPKRGRHVQPVARKSSRPRYRSSEFQSQKLSRLNIYDYAVQSNGLPHEIDATELVLPSGVVGALKRGGTT